MECDEAGAGASASSAAATPQQQQQHPSASSAPTEEEEEDGWTVVRRKKWPQPRRLTRNKLQGGRNAVWMSMKYQQSTSRWKNNKTDKADLLHGGKFIWTRLVGTVGAVVYHVQVLNIEFKKLWFGLRRFPPPLCDILSFYRSVF